MTRLSKILTLVIVSLTIISVQYFFKKPSNPSSLDHLPIIGITQIIEHTALDQEREGILDTLAKAGYVDGKTVKILYQNAQGNISTAAQIITQMIGHQPKAIVAISTPSAQAALGLCLSKNIPLVFTSVTDPMGAKLVKDMHKRKEAVTGVTDNLPMESQINLMLDFFPHLKTLGVIYNAGESNSVMMIKALQEKAAKKNIQIIEATAAKTSDVGMAMNSLVGKVQAVYVPNDNTAVAAINSIVQVADRNKIPVFTGDTGSVASGAFATQGYDRFLLGKKTGELLVKILRGKNAGELPVDTDHPLFLTLNRKTAEKIGIVIPPALLKTAHFVGE